ncbi:MAG: hypothetical protein ACYSPI_03385 [Planctomycetota bacterium]|jgi:hypothetical protein
MDNYIESLREEQPEHDRQARQIVEKYRYIRKPPHPACRLRKYCTAALCPAYYLSGDRDYESAVLCCQTEQAETAMAPTKRSKLATFIRRYCGKFCTGCDVMKGKPCDWFETAVFKEIDKKNYKYYSHHPDYKRILTQYKKINPAFQQISKNACNQCGTSIPPRKKLCIPCAKLNQKDNWKRQNQKRRNKGKEGNSQ